MIQKLEWDSEFFNYPVGLVEIKDEKSIVAALKESTAYKLTYLVSDHEVAIGNYGLLVDIKTTLCKIASARDVIVDAHLVEYDGRDDKQLIDLALQAGIYSRFKKDRGFVNNEFEKLYKKWLIESIHKNTADHVIVHQEKDAYNGFVTVKIKPDFVEIGLIAVNEAVRGRGIGRELLNAVHVIAVKRGLNIKVTTQFQNLPAMKFYINNGFDIIAKKYIYHIWNNDCIF